MPEYASFGLNDSRLERAENSIIHAIAYKDDGKIYESIVFICDAQYLPISKAVKYLAGIIKEVLRLNSNVYIIMRYPHLQ